MGRGNKKSLAAPRAPARAPSPPTATPPVAKPVVDRLPVKCRRLDDTPRITLDQPWRDLHPVRVWPD